MPLGASTYNPKNVTLNIGGVFISGFSEGDFITAAPEADLYTNLVGADGLTTRTTNLNRNWTMSVSLMQSSLSNAALTGFVELGKRLDFARDIVKVVLIDGNGDTALSAPQAWFTRWPDVTYGADLGSREWSLYLVDPVVLIAGLPLDNLVG